MGDLAVGDDTLDAASDLAALMLMGGLGYVLKGVWLLGAV